MQNNGRQEPVKMLHLVCIDLFAVSLQFIVSRLGRWIDFNNDYKTLYPWFMESVWLVCFYMIECLSYLRNCRWVFKQIYEKGLVYRGFKVCLQQFYC